MSPEGDRHKEEWKMAEKNLGKKKRGMSKAEQLLDLNAKLYNLTMDMCENREEYAPLTSHAIKHTLLLCDVAKMNMESALYHVTLLEEAEKNFSQLRGHYKKIPKEMYLNKLDLEDEKQRAEQVLKADEVAHNQIDIRKEIVKKIEAAAPAGA